MAKPGKIEKYQLEPFIAGLQKKNKEMTMADIATACNRQLQSQGIKDSISAMAVQRYTHRLPSAQGQVIRDSKRLVTKTIEAEYDIIQSQLRVSRKMYDQLDQLEDIPTQVEEYFKRITAVIKDANDDSDQIISMVESFFKHVRSTFLKQLQELAIINKEVRANNEFLTKLQEKIYEYGLIQEFIRYFLEAFRKRDEESYRAAIQEVAKDPRMAKVVEQQMVFNGGGKRDE